jgi:hypothetical protein
MRAFIMGRRSTSPSVRIATGIGISIATGSGSGSTPRRPIRCAAASEERD